MSKIRVFVSPMVVLAVALVGQQSLAQEATTTNPHFQIHAIRRTGVPKVATPAAPVLFPLLTSMGVLPPPDGGGADTWPCFTGGTDADCSSIALGGVVVGVPAYTWSLSNCTATSTSTANCGQIYWMYEDDSGSSDDLVVTLTVKQGANYILDTGKVDLGPNFGETGISVIISDDTAFGTQGQTGKNNGFCAGSNKICVQPVAGPATISWTTQVGTLPKISGKATINLQ